MLHGAQLGAKGVVEIFRLGGQFGQACPGGILKLIGVDDLGGSILVAGEQLIGEGVFTAGENSFKKTRFIGGRQGGNNLARLEILDANFEGMDWPAGLSERRDRNSGQQPNVQRASRFPFMTEHPLRPGPEWI